MGIFEPWTILMALYRLVFLQALYTYEEIPD